MPGTPRPRSPRCSRRLAGATAAPRQQYCWRGAVVSGTIGLEPRSDHRRADLRRPTVRSRGPTTEHTQLACALVPDDVGQPRSGSRNCSSWAGSRRGCVQVTPERTALRSPSHTAASCSGRCPGARQPYFGSGDSRRRLMMGVARRTADRGRTTAPAQQRPTARRGGTRTLTRVPSVPCAVCVRHAGVRDADRALEHPRAQHPALRDRAVRPSRTSSWAAPVHRHPRVAEQSLVADSLGVLQRRAAGTARRPAHTAGRGDPAVQHDRRDGRQEPLAAAVRPDREPCRWHRWRRRGQQVLGSRGTPKPRPAGAGRGFGVVL